LQPNLRLYVCLVTEIEPDKKPEKFIRMNNEHNFTHTDMKKSVLFLLFVLLGLVQTQAQEEGAKLAKKAAKDLVSYNIDPAGNKAKLQEAKQKIDEAMKLADAQAIGTAWITQGNVYSTLAQQAVSMRVVNASAPLPTDNYALTAYQGFKKGYTLSEKKYDKKDAIAGIKEVENNITIFGYDAYERKDYKSSYEAFAATLESIEVLKAAGETSMYAKPKDMQNQLFLTGLTAQLAGNNDVAMPIYEKLVATGDSIDASVYQGLYQMKLAKGQEKEALEVLTAGRKAYPDDTALLFDEINAYLKQGKMDELITNLKKAIEKESGNVDLYVTLGNVYDNLYQKASTEKNTAKATEYEALARKTYEEALTKDPKNANAVYSIGAIAFNKAALLTQEMNTLSTDVKNMSKVDKLGDQVKALFVEALPYFKKAEGLDPNNENTLIALREIFARQDELDLASEFSKRLKVVQEKGKNPTSYFK
jgi:tetratricopeptide (TPR) repeat protein